MVGIGGKIDAAAARAAFEAALESHEQVFGSFFLAKLLGLEFAYLPEAAADADKDCCRISFEVTEMMMNPRGTLHGGIMATVMDISMGHLLTRSSGPGATVEMKVQFMLPVGAGPATCEGRFLRRGRSMSFLESRFFDGGGGLAGMATATWKML